LVLPNPAIAVCTNNQHHSSGTQQTMAISLTGSECSAEAGFCLTAITAVGFVTII
jgi:hypothetical protein